MSRSKMYGALSFMVVLHDGSGFLGPALRPGGGLSPSPAAAAAGLRRSGDSTSERAFVSSTNLGVTLSRTSAARNERGAFMVGPRVSLNEGSSCSGSTGVVGSQKHHVCVHVERVLMRGV